MRQTAEPTIPTGQWFTEADGHRWWFDSGSVAIDFAYTGAIGDDTGRERLQDASALASWLLARFTAVGGDVGERDLTDARALRSAIAGLTAAASGGPPAPATDVDIVNLFAATPDIPPALAGGSRQAGRTRARAGQALSAMAREAVDLFGAEATGAGRVRECAAEDCAIVFYDDSRSNNRRWCSMQRCGNRAKVRAHRSRAAG